MFFLNLSWTCAAHWSTTCFYPELPSLGSLGEGIPNGGVQRYCHHIQVILARHSELIVIQFVLQFAPEFTLVCVSRVSYCYLWSDNEGSLNTHQPRPIFSTQNYILWHLRPFASFPHPRCRSREKWGKYPLRNHKLSKKTFNFWKKNV